MALAKMADWFWAGVLCLFAELLIWAISLALSGPGWDFLASILGMVSVFAIMEILGLIWKETGPAYQEYIKSKVDLINHNLGVGFAIPIVMVGKTRGTLLGTDTVGRVMGAFAGTNAIFWLLIIVLAWGMVCGVAKTSITFDVDGGLGTVRNLSSSSDIIDEWLVMEAPGAAVTFRTIFQQHSSPDSGWERGGGAVEGPVDGRIYRGTEPKESRLASGITTTSVDGGNSVDPSTNQTENSLIHSEPRQAPAASKAKRLDPAALILVCLLTIAIPLSAYAAEGRVLDICVLGLAWIGSGKAQLVLREATSLPVPAQTRRAAWILMNPVLLTTLVLICYTRAKSALAQRDLVDVLSEFSGGAPLERLWSFWAFRIPLEKDQTDWFGAGDAALALLQCGMVAWGFKLYECRRQLWSRGGLLVIFGSMAASVLSAFISVALGKAVGLELPEALAFAARSTTLVLAKPATEALGGNTVVNAALVVSNGIMGQLLAPYLLQWLSAHGVHEEEQRGTGEEQRRAQRIGGDVDIENSAGGEQEEPLGNSRDSAAAIAAGSAIGINGIAMGVSYLYERRSRAAPYAALAMISFGITTTFLTSFEPFKGALTAIAQA